jgi:capsular polysaccharide transport system ATP-binding protein
MIELENVSKHYHLSKGHKVVFSNLNFRIEKGETIGICGANGAGKSTLIRLIAGIERPTAGKVTRKMTTSWPMGYAGCFQHTLTGADNVRFIARIYGRPEAEVLAFVEDFAQLGEYMHQPVSTYSAGMGGRLSFGVSLAVDFDCYLVDEGAGAGDQRFQRRTQEALESRFGRASLIMTSHSPAALQAYCRRGAVLYGGSLVVYDTIEEACEVHTRLQMRGM